MHVDLINVVYLAACILIRSTWFCMFLMTSSMTLNPQRKSTITSQSLVWRANPTCKLICVFWYQVYRALLRDRTFNRSVSIAIQQAFWKPCPENFLTISVMHKDLPKVLQCGTTFSSDSEISDNICCCRLRLPFVLKLDNIIHILHEGI